MTNLFRLGAYAALMVGSVIVTDLQAQQVLQPIGGDYLIGAPRRSPQLIVKDGPTIVPVVDSNAILNLDYKEMRATPVMAAKPAVITKPVIIAEPTLAELKLQLKNSEQQHKANKLAYTQAVRAKDKTRVEQAKIQRNNSAAQVAQLKKQIAAKQPKAVKAPKKKTRGAQRNGVAAAPVK